MTVLNANPDIGIAVTTLISGGIGAYLGAYLKRKGENLATHEDIAKLLDQVRAVTTITKEIEAKISDEAWDRQKRWELKREVLFEAAKRLAEVDDALLSLISVSNLEHRQDQSTWLEAKVERQKRWIKATTALDETRLLVGIVCGGETIIAFEEFASLASEIVVKMSKNLDAYNELKIRYTKSLFATRAAIRKELGIGGAVAIQTSGAAPNRD